MILSLPHRAMECERRFLDTQTARIYEEIGLQNHIEKCLKYKKATLSRQNDYLRSPSRLMRVLYRSTSTFLTYLSSRLRCPTSLSKPRRE